MAAAQVMDSAGMKDAIRVYISSAGVGCWLRFLPPDVLEAMDDNDNVYHYGLMGLNVI